VLVASFVKADFFQCVNDPAQSWVNLIGYSVDPAGVEYPAVDGEGES
jgi:hypothetical protein